ncbi:MAG: type II toxin-antitoxin system VapC family toxin [Longimicrobiales bacterium]
MGVLIDASVLIESERGRIDLAQRIAGREEEEFFLSVVTASELLHGVHRASDDGVRSRRAAFVEGVIERFPLLSIDLETARAHARLWADLAGRGALIGPHDMWLAGACLAHGLTLVTGNTREFERVPGLAVENWAEDQAEA